MIRARAPAVSQLKSNRWFFNQKEPREGTYIRQVYDLLIENAGEPVPISTREKAAFSRTISQLTDFYSLDIRLIRKGSKVRGASLYCLVGYWDGPDYVDCLAAKKPNVDGNSTNGIRRSARVETIDPCRDSLEEEK